MKRLKQSEVKAYRDQMLKAQDGKCAFCGQDCKKPCLDHAHRDPYKDKIRGVVCNWCNIAIGKLENARVRTGTSWEDFEKSFKKIHYYIWGDWANYLTSGFSEADWHPSKRKSEVTEFRKMTSNKQRHRLREMVIEVSDYSRNGLYKEWKSLKNATERVSLFKKLNNKT